jgi:hypothetical protein
MVMKKTVAAIQSNYIPWKGYFDVIHDVDLFIFLDHVKYTKGDWRNRNLIKTPKGAKWLTIPVGQSTDRPICEVRLEDKRWQTKHFRILQNFYSKTPYFRTYKDFLEHVYLERVWGSLSELNHSLIRAIAKDFLGITTEMRDSRELGPKGQKLEGLIDLLTKSGAERYVSGSAAKHYIDPQRFQDTGIELIYKDYSGYPEYPQLFPPFTHEVTVLDLLFNVGANAPYFIWGWRDELKPKHQ